MINMVNNTEEEKKKLFMDEEFWYPILEALDEKIKIVCTNFGYGQVQVTFVIRQNMVLDVMYADEIRVRGFPGKTEPQIPKKDIDKDHKT